MLSFLQEGLDRLLSLSTYKVSVAAIEANDDIVDGKSVGKHNIIFRFLRSARRLNPPTANLIPSWDLSVVLQALQGDPFEPLQSVELSALSIKMAFLTVLTSVKKVRDHPALSVNEMCLEFGPADSHIVLRPWPSYVLKVPTTLFRDQMVTWQALPPDEGDPALSLLCTVHAYSHTVYLDCTKSLRQSEQFFVRHIKSEVLGGHTQPGASLPLWPH